MYENLNETNVNVSTTTPQIEIIENTQETVIVNGEEMTFQQAIYLEAVKTILLNLPTSTAKVKS